MVVKDSTTSLARVALGGVAVITEHTENIDSISATLASVVTANSAAVYV